MLLCGRRQNIKYHVEPLIISYADNGCSWDYLNREYLLFYRRTKLGTDKVFSVFFFIYFLFLPLYPTPPPPPPLLRVKRYTSYYCRAHRRSERTRNNPIIIIRRKKYGGKKKKKCEKIENKFRNLRFVFYFFFFSNFFFHPKTPAHVIIHSADCDVIPVFFVGSVDNRFFIIITFRLVYFIRGRGGGGGFFFLFSQVKSKRINKC